MMTLIETRDVQRRMGTTCPHCDARASVRTSKAVTSTYREYYYACSNLICGHSWKATLTFLHTISPSATPRPGLNLPLAPPEAFCPRRLPTPANDPGPSHQNAPRGPAVPQRAAANDDDPIAEGMIMGG